MEDSRVLSRRRSFSGTLFKAAAAVAVHYRGLRDSLKAASADLINDVRDGGQDKLTSRSDRVSSDNLGQHATTLCQLSQQKIITMLMLVMTTTVIL